MRTPHLALVSANGAREMDEDLPPLRRALQDAGAQTSVVSWDDPQVNWAVFDLALLRSTWDYATRLPQFLAWIQFAAERTRVLNPPDVVRWNTDKHYLTELARAGVAVIPGAFFEPGADARGMLDAVLDAHRDAADFVVKPCVGAGSKDAQRHVRDSRDNMLAHLVRLLDAGRGVLMQPYLPSVDTHGETALLFFEGSYSHAIRKGPLLQRGAHPASGLFAAEQITPREPTAGELDVAQRAISAIPFVQPLLYARVDIVLDEIGAPRLLELELTEPSVFLDHAAGAAARFAAAILARIHSVRHCSRRDG